MKKTIFITAVLFTTLLIILIIATDKVDTTPYFEEEYFKTSVARIDSLKEITTSVRDSVYAGFGKVSITPVLNSSEDNIKEGRFISVPLAGYGDRKGKPSTGIHDSIFVKAAAIRTGTSTVILISADLLIMPPNITDSVAKLLYLKGIRRDQLFFSATHSHSSLGGWGIGYIGEQFAGKENSNLQKWMVRRVTEAAELAISDLQPARIGSGNFSAGIYTRNRLIGESGTKNDDFSFICIEQNGRRKAVIGSFSGHATTLGDENMEISADYPGYWERKSEEKSADIAIFFAGAMGSQSPAGEGNGFEKSRLIGEALADSMVKHLDQVKLNDQIVFSAVSLKLSLPDYNIRITTKRNLSSALSKKLLSPPENACLQVMRIDDMVWITTPSDFSGEYALQIKNALAVKGFKSNISSFNGTYVGYIIPGRYFYLNEYESKLMGWFGPNMGEYTVDLIGRLVKIVTEEMTL